MAFALFGGLLVFYLLVTCIVKFKPFNAKPELLLWIHQSSLGLALLLLTAYAALGISLRGSWLDALPFGLAWLAAAGYFALRRQQLGWPGKLYFGSWFVWPAALGVAYLLDGIFFALVSAPVFGMLPTPVIYYAPECTIRQASGGLLSAPKAELLTPLGLLLERHQGTAPRDCEPSDGEAECFQNVLSARVQPSPSPGSTIVLISTAQGQYQVLFRR